MAVARFGDAAHPGLATASGPRFVQSAAALDDPGRESGPHSEEESMGECADDLLHVFTGSGVSGSTPRHNCKLLPRLAGPVSPLR